MALPTKRQLEYLKPWWKVLMTWYCIIRPLFVEDINVNEDYNCCECNKPVLRRVMLCSVKCVEPWEKALRLTGHANKGDKKC